MLRIIFLFYEKYLYTIPIWYIDYTLSCYVSHANHMHIEAQGREHFDNDWCVLQ